MLKASQIRINSIALIHEKLYQSSDHTRIYFDVYVRELTNLIEKLFLDEEQNANLLLDIYPIPLTINQAIPCGLILNELVTNSYKHAFDEEQEGEIQISMHRDKDLVGLTVQDNGKGLPGNLYFESPTTLGITLVSTLSKQMEGSYTFSKSNDGGMKFDLSF